MRTSTVAFAFWYVCPYLPSALSDFVLTFLCMVVVLHPLLISSSIGIPHLLYSEKQEAEEEKKKRCLPEGMCGRDIETISK